MYGLELGRSVRRTGVGHIVRPRSQLVIAIMLEHSLVSSSVNDNSLPVFSLKVIGIDDVKMSQ